MKVPPHPRILDVGETRSLDVGAPPAAQVLLALARLDAEIEALELQEVAFMRRLERVRRLARDVQEEFRTQEIQLAFVESSLSHMVQPVPHKGGAGVLPEALRNMRENLDTSKQQCKQFATSAEAEAREAQEAFTRAHRCIESGRARRQMLTIPRHLLQLYKTSFSIGRLPRVVAVENGACGGCGTEVTGAPQDGTLRTCAGCRRVLYWRQIRN
jgi:predicted  nucleic acid-binding Zn-ribbon protein